MALQAVQQNPFLQIPVYINRKCYDRIRNCTKKTYEVKYDDIENIQATAGIRQGDSLLFTCNENLALLPHEHQRNYQRQLEQVVTIIEEDALKKRRIIHFKNEKIRKRRWSHP